MNKLPEHISYSSFNTWLECGWKYKLTKMYEVPEKHAVWLTGGTAVHKATERFDLNERVELLNPESVGSMGRKRKDDRTYLRHC